jgi:hypothetical protein
MRRFYIQPTATSKQWDPSALKAKTKIISRSGDCSEDEYQADTDYENISESDWTESKGLFA